MPLPEPRVLFFPGPDRIVSGDGMKVRFTGRKPNKEEWAERYSSVPVTKMLKVFDEGDWESYWNQVSTEGLGEGEATPRIAADSVIVRIAGFGGGVTYEEGAVVEIVEQVKKNVGERCDFVVVDGDYLKTASFAYVAAALVEAYPLSTLLLVRSCHVTHFKFLRPFEEEEEGWEKFGERVVVMHGAPPPEEDPSGILNAFAADVNVYVGGGNESKRELALLVPGNDFCGAGA